MNFSNSSDEEIQIFYKKISNNVKKFRKNSDIKRKHQVNYI